MVLNADAAVAQAKQMLEWRETEQRRLSKIHDYLRGDERLLWLPSGVPPEVPRLARMSHVNVLRFVVNASTQALYVDGYRSREDSDNQPAWETWQRNRFDAHQVGVHRAALSYGASYVTVLPGEPVSVLKGASPRKMTVVYGDDDDWPMWALEKRRTDRGQLWRLFDDQATYWLGQEPNSDALTFISYDIHDAGHPPVVRYLETDDLDDEVTGVVEPLMALQDQINVTTFSLLVAQHYGAHRQRYIIGWLAESEEQALKASAQKLWTFDDDPDHVKVGEFEQTDLSGYIESREATLRHLATISQTPVHELLGSIANLSAEALVAARDSHNRSLEEHRVMFGESHEQTLAEAASQSGMDIDPAAWVRWKDMEARSLAQVADALGKFAESLGIPRRAMWERAAEAMGASQQEVESWDAMAAEEGSSSIDDLAALLDRQMSDSTA